MIVVDPFNFNLSCRSRRCRTTTIAPFTLLDPFFSVVMEGLSKFTGGEHYFDTLADDVLFEFRYHMAGWPEVMRGRGEPHVALFRGTATTSGSSAAMRWPCIHLGMV